MTNQNLIEADRWLQQARHDLEVARWNAKGKFWSDTCFMSQQAAEKALKAFCYAQGERDVIGHALLVLVRRCAKYDASFRQLEAECKKLDKYYIISRYPNGLPGLIPAEYFDEGEANTAIQQGDSIIKHVEQKLTLLRSSTEQDDETGKKGQGEEAGQGSE